MLKTVCRLRTPYRIRCLLAIIGTRVMTEATEVLEGARKAYEGHDWSGARAGFKEVKSQRDLSLDDLEALADCAWWLGDVDDAMALYEETYRLYLHGEEPQKAAMSAMGLAVSLFLRGDMSMGSGWMSRAQRLLAGAPESEVNGYMMYLDLEGSLAEADYERVVETAKEVRRIGERFSDPNLIVPSICFEGRALIAMGKVAEGMPLLDEAMVGVVSGELIPDWAGNVYCHLMAACYELADIRRANEFVTATEKWLETLPEAVLFRGVCRVHRSQILQLQGSWDRSESEALRVCEDLATIHASAAAEGHYQVGEVRRLRGDLDGAEQAYARAHGLGRDPQPGLAMLRLSQGRRDEAQASIGAALIAEASNRLARARLLSAQVQICIASRDIKTARGACEELEAIATEFGSSGLKASLLHAQAILSHAEESPDAALPLLREACRTWNELGAPYDAACIRLLLFDTYRALGDEDAAGRELEAATAVFDRLGASTPASRDGASGKGSLPAGLTEREGEVLALVASGRSNRQVAETLVVSEKTVARHMSNIFAKLGVTSRTEAAAFAFRHDMAPRE
jgi:DNA-binding CsgD family transcriptional regulator